MIGWTTDQFWDATPYEFNLAIEAHTESRDADWERTATHAAWIMNCWVKRQVTAAKLLGKTKSLEGLGGVDGMERYWKEKQRRGKR